MELYIQIGLMALSAVLTLVVSWVSWKLNKYRKFEEERKKRELARDNLQLAVARAMIIRECNHYIAKVHAPLCAVENIF